MITQMVLNEEEIIYDINSDEEYQHVFDTLESFGYKQYDRLGNDRDRWPNIMYSSTTGVVCGNCSEYPNPLRKWVSLRDFLERVGEYSEPEDNTLSELFENKLKQLRDEH